MQKRVVNVTYVFRTKSLQRYLGPYGSYYSESLATFQIV